jgi:environmental stress-induced protein Ves
MQVLRKSSFTPTPWKNGGGITHEAIRVPEHGTAFRWRVSVAQIDASGPFSEFAEYNRKMVLLQGSGIRLTFGGGLQTHLREVGDLAEFDGALATECELLSGPCVDLNLMVSKSIPGVRAWVERLRAPRSLHPAHGTMLAFAISGSVSVRLGNREFTSLQAWDLAVVSPQDRCEVRPVTMDQPLVFFATVDDNSP